MTGNTVQISLSPATQYFRSHSIVLGGELGDEGIQFSPGKGTLHSKGMLEDYSTAARCKETQTNQQSN